MKFILLLTWLASPWQRSPWMSIHLPTSPSQTSTKQSPSFLLNQLSDLWIQNMLELKIEFDSHSTIYDEICQKTTFNFLHHIKRFTFQHSKSSAGAALLNATINIWRNLPRSPDVLVNSVRSSLHDYLYVFQYLLCPTPQSVKVARFQLRGAIKIHFRNKLGIWPNPFQ